jgi:O-antigen ligase
VPVIGFESTAAWTAVSCFLAATSLVYALILSDNTEQRLDMLLKGYMAAAIVVSIIAVLAYFRLMPSAETFLFAGRSKATFKDPNVFGPFLVLPGLIAIQHAVLGRARDVLLGALTLLLILVGLLLSFSRGAWGHFAVSVVLMLGMMFVTSRSSRERVRIITIAVAGTIVMALFVVALLSIPQVASLFSERANLVQSYDAGHTGRFGRHILGFLMIFDHPIGIGPLQFSKFFPEDPHNSFLDAFMAGGWLGGFAYAALVLVTLAAGLREVFAAAPWQRTYIAVYATYLGVVGESYIIDTNHWRHYFLVLGLIWGLMVVRRAHSARVLRTVWPRPAAALAAPLAPQPCRG